MTWYSCTSFDAYLFCSPTNLDARCNVSSFCVPRFFLPSFFSFFTYYETRERAPEIYAIGGEFRDTPRSAERVSRPPLGSFPNLFHFLKTFLKHDDADVFLERIKDIKYRIFYESSTGKWKRKKKFAAHPLFSRECFLSFIRLRFQAYLIEIDREVYDIFFFSSFFWEEIEKLWRISTL